MADAGMLGRRLSHYRVLEFLGSGGMGDVYHARDEKLDREVAVKVVPAGLTEADAGRRRIRFRKECRALCRVAHPHVATLFDFDSTDGVDFLVMELVPGPTLATQLLRGRLREDEALRLAGQLVRGIQAVHALGIVHRDIKPSNIAFTVDGPPQDSGLRGGEAAVAPARGRGWPRRPTPTSEWWPVPCPTCRRSSS